MTRKFVAIGECMIEMSPKGDDLFGMGFAGDTFNTAWYMQQITQGSVDVAFVSAVGDDAVSQRMTQFITACGITPIMQVRAGRSVGLYVVSLDHGERSFSYWRSASAARTLADDMDDLPVVAGDMAYFSGITLAILPDAGKERLLAVLTAYKAQGVTIVFDPNLRPRLWQDTAQMCAWTMKGAAISDVCLPSFDDEALHFGDDSLNATCTRYAAQGTGIVIAKNGGGPILIQSAGHQDIVQPDVVGSVVDTTAAGDSFNAGFLSARMNGASLTEAVTRACALSAKVIAQTGALVKIEPTFDRS